MLAQVLLCSEQLLDLEEKNRRRKYEKRMDHLVKHGNPKRPAKTSAERMLHRDRVREKLTQKYSIEVKQEFIEVNAAVNDLTGLMGQHQDVKIEYVSCDEFDTMGSQSALGSPQTRLDPVSRSQADYMESEIPLFSR